MWSSSGEPNCVGIKMLQINRTSDWLNPGNMPPEFPSSPGTLADAIAFVRRRLTTIFLTFVAALAVAVVYLIAVAPTFTADAELIIDSKAAPVDSASVSTIVESQIAIIKSEGIARAVIGKLDLAEDPEFAGQGLVRAMVRSTSRLLGWSRPGAEPAAMRYALETFKRKLSVKRVGLTYIVEVTFDASDPERAAQILSTVAETYLMAQMNAKYRSALQSEKWVKDRMNELQLQASAARKAVADYRKSGDDVAGATDAAALGASRPVAKSQDELRELEVSADAAARTYDNFVRALRYMEAQQQSSPVLEARLLNEVSSPPIASWPKVGIVLGMSIAGGVLLGIALGMLRDLLDRESTPAGKRSRLTG